jgi:hypothetical protein
MMNSHEKLAAQAEEVRTYIVSVRGGAPFLSAADGRLLVMWLEDGITVARILAAVDQVAEKRRKKRTRGRLSLSACRRVVEGKKQSKSINFPPVTPLHSPLDAYAADLETMAIAPNLLVIRQNLVRRIRDLSQIDDIETLASEAIRAIVAFHEATWQASNDQYEALRNQAHLELTALKSILSPAAFEAAVDEVSRDLLRQRNPLVSAKEIWDRLATV